MQEISSELQDLGISDSSARYNLKMILNFKKLSLKIICCCFINTKW